MTLTHRAKLYIKQRPIFKYIEMSMALLGRLPDSLTNSETLRYSQESQAKRNIKKIALFELERGHQETLASAIYYFNRLGFHVDLFLLHNDHLSQYRNFDNSISKYCCELNYDIYRLLNRHYPNVPAYNLINKENYDFFFFSTFFEDWGWPKRICQYASYLKPSKSIALRHSYTSPHLNHYHENKWLYENIVQPDNAMVIAKHLKSNNNQKLLACTYFGRPEPSKIDHSHIRFLSIGSIDFERREYSLLIKICKRLNEAGYQDRYSIDIGGHIPSKNRKTREFLKFIRKTPNVFMHQNITTNMMFDLARKSDFYFFLLDDQVKSNQSYFSGKTTGGYGLCLGNSMIPILKDSYVRHWGFEDIAVSYDDEDSLYKKMIDILENPEKYQALKNEVAKFNQDIQEESLQDLRSVMEHLEQENS